jgi:serine protease Do
MKKIIIAILGLCLISSAFGWGNGNNHKSISQILKQQTQAVVNITVQRKSADEVGIFGQSRTNNKSKQKALFGVGSGVIFNAKKGYIVTNAHVVKDAKIIVVRLKNGRRYFGKLIGLDKGFDLAVVKISSQHLHQIEFADSNKLNVGDRVIAIGSPFNLDQTVTAGVVSALNVSRPKIEGFQSFIQTDASINPGNSGGALINTKGELVGINTAIIGPGANIGIGFAIPSNMTYNVIQQLIKYGKVKRGLLGVIAQNITPELAQAIGIERTQGALVAQVVSGSPAATAGIQAEDIITEVNNHVINNSAQLRNTLGLLAPGTKLNITLIRDEHKKEIKATVANPKAMFKQRFIPFLSGLAMRNFSELQGDGSELQGVIIDNVKETSQAAIAGLLPGDVVITANEKPTRNTTELAKIALTHPKQLLLKIKRGNWNLFVVITKRNS